MIGGPARFQAATNVDSVRVDSQNNNIKSLPGDPTTFTTFIDDA